MLANLNLKEHKYATTRHNHQRHIKITSESPQNHIKPNDTH